MRRKGKKGLDCGGGGGCGKFVSEEKALEAGRVEGNIGVKKGEKEEEGMF